MQAAKPHSYCSKTELNCLKTKIIFEKKVFENTEAKKMSAATRSVELSTNRFSFKCQFGQRFSCRGWITEIFYLSLLKVVIKGPSSG